MDSVSPRSVAEPTARVEDVGDKVHLSFEAAKMRTTRQKRADFRKLHENGCFVLPNPWDVGTARMFQHLGFSALASTSAGFGWAHGRPDYGLVRDEVLAHLRALSAATDLPVNADFQARVGAQLGGLAESGPGAGG